MPVGNLEFKIYNPINCSKVKNVVLFQQGGDNRPVGNNTSDAKTLKGQ